LRAASRPSSKVKDAPAILSRPTKSDDFVVELPMAYSLFLVARRHEKAISGWVDFNLRLNVRTPDLATPIVVTYEISTWIWLLAASGLMVVLALVVYPRHKIVITAQGAKLSIVRPAVPADCCHAVAEIILGKRSFQIL